MYTYTTRGQAKSQPKQTERHTNQNDETDAGSNWEQRDDGHGTENGFRGFQKEPQDTGQNMKETKKAPEPEHVRTETTDDEYKRKPDERRHEETEGKLKVPILRISYTYISLFFHLYIAWFHLATLVRYPPWRIENFCHFIYIVSGLYHIFTLLSYFLMPALHRIVVAHGTWIVNAALWYPIFLTTRWPNAVAKDCNDFRQQDGDPPLMNSSNTVIPYCGFVTDLGTFQAVFVPLISWFVYLLFLRRRSVSLIIWEQESRYLALRARWKRILTEEEMYEKELVGIPEEDVVYAPGRGIGVGWIYRMSRLLSPGLLPAGWWWWWLTGEESLTDLISPTSDMSVYPGLLRILVVTVWANMSLWIWVSLNGFQYRGVVWKRNLKEGVALWVNGAGLLVGGWVR